MKLPKIKKYQKKFNYSYVFGAYPSLDLFKYRRKDVLRVVFHSEGVGAEGISELRELCKLHEISNEVNDKLISKIAVKKNTYVVTFFQKYETDLSDTANHLILYSPRNMGNLGTIIRTMVGFGIEDLAIIRPGADIFDPKVTRSTMGALFKIRFKYFDSFSEYIQKYSRHKKYLFMLDGEKEIDDVSFEPPFSLVMGNESSGLPEESKQYGEIVFIPHSDAIDSLNLSVATGIALYYAKNTE